MRVRINGVFLPVCFLPGCDEGPAEYLAAELGDAGGAHLASEQMLSAIWVGVWSELVHPWGVYVQGLVEPVPQPPATAGWFTFENNKLVIWGQTRAQAIAAAARFVEWLGFVPLGPHPDWRLQPTLADDIDAPPETTFELPTFLLGLGTGGGVMAEQLAAAQSWAVRAGIPNTGRWPISHTWAAFVNDTPGYSPGNGVVSSTGYKLACSDPQVQRDFSEWLEGQLGDGLNVLSISPSDGGGWEEPLDGAMTPIDRVLTLAEAVCDDFTVPLSLLVYDATSADPPTVEVPADSLEVWVDSARILGGRSYAQVLSDFEGRGHNCWAYEPIAVWSQTHGIPGLGAATDLDKVFAAAYRLDVLEGGTVDADDGWVPHGRAYYALAYPHEAVSRWLAYPELAFPSCPDQARAFYDLLGLDAPLTSDLVRRVAEAVKEVTYDLELANVGDESAEYQRALDLVRYVIYLDQLHGYQRQPSAGSMDNLLREVTQFYREGRYVIPYFFAFHDPTWERDRKAAAVLHGLQDLTPTSMPWPFTARTPAQLRSELMSTIADNPMRPYTPVAWGRIEEYVPTDRWASDSRPVGTPGVYTWNPCTWFVWPTTTVLTLRVKAGIGLQNKGPSTVLVYDTDDELVASVTVPPDRVEHVYAVDVPDGDGPVKVVVEDPKAGGCLVVFSNTDHVVHDLSETSSVCFQGGLTGYFVVPAGTTQIGGYTNATAMQILTDAGVLVGHPTAAGFFLFTVVESPTDRVFKLVNAAGLTYLETCPPAIALHPSRLALPPGL